MGKHGFFIKLTVFAAPLLIVMGGAVGVAVYSGEAIPPRAAYAVQASSPGALYMTSHRRYDFQYKYFGFEYNRPEVVFVGASRVLTFRAAFLNRNPSAAYNASLPGHGMASIEAFIDQFTPENAPKIMLLQVDQFWFNADWPTASAVPVMQIHDLEPDRIITDTRHMLREMLRGGISINQLLRRAHPAFNRLALGIDAIRNGDAYAADGAIQIVPRPYDRLEQWLKLATALENAEAGNGHYLHGDTVNETALMHLERMLDKAAALEIEVIGFAPGYMPTLYKTMLADGQHSYHEKAMPRVQALFEARGFHFFDFSDLSIFGGDAELVGEMLDGNHATEMLSLRMYMKMVEGVPEVLGAYSDLEGLQTLIDNAPNPHEVVPRDYQPASVP